MSPFSTIGGICETLLFLINLDKIENFFLAEMLGLCIVELTVLKNASFDLLFAFVDSMLEVLDSSKAFSRFADNLVNIWAESVPLDTAAKY